MYPGIIPKIVAPPQKKATMLLHFDGANGSQVFVDSSLNNLAVGFGGNVQIDTSTSVFGGSCCTFDGIGDYLYCDHPAALKLPGDFTCEGRMRCTAETTNSRPVFDIRGGTNNAGFFINLNPSEQLDIYIDANDGAGGVKRATSGTLTAGTWYHWAICRASGVIRCFLNGTQFGSNFSTSVAWDSTSLNIGTFVGERDTGGPDHKYKGNMDEIRISNNLARYIANFTPAGSAFDRYD
ncbi:LamG domain-containing protein [Mesorhizobium sp. CA7]|uniref:LamG domain-containing protein n=1 Tax=Mesorhizobium sp. CA7 TaxID=588501 RepID=UPI001CCE0DBF|nr:LamG domain-containing protein [Mesorhizobium sp. CA7]MBZ9816717.1 LamG domain-containing protein [Mesorhizobium sp. CA7]